MRIEGISPSGTAQPSGTAGLHAPGVRFSDLLAGQTQKSAPLSAVLVPGHKPAGIHPPDAARNRDAYRHGRAMLGALRALQAALLGGGTEAARATLAALAGNATAADDPQLAASLHDIAVRAAVELARQP